MYFILDFFSLTELKMSSLLEIPEITFWQFACVLGGWGGGGGFWPHHTVCGILVSRPVVKPRPSAVRAQSPNQRPPGNFWQFFFFFF